MATNITFGTFSLQDSTYTTSDVEYRTIPAREIVLEDIARKPGKKLISQEFAERRIRLAGWILGTSASNLITVIDNLHTNVTQKVSGTLTIDTNREIEAIVASVTIPEPHYTQTAVPFQLELVAAEPFWKGPQQTVSVTTASGTSQQTISTTISGSVFAEPQITYNAPSGSGYTTTSGVIVEYGPTGEKITWSGTNASNPTLAYGDFARFDYENQLILEGSSEVNPFGVFSRWKPGSTNITITYSGIAQGGSVSMVYRPRYL